MHESSWLPQFWSSAWEGAGWGPAWKGAFEGLSPQQAAWAPSVIDGDALEASRRGRVHSIWQILNHVVFWRETVVASLRGERPSEDDIARRNWEAPAPGAPGAPGDVTDRAWAEAKARYVASHELMANAIGASEDNARRLAEMFPHDAYHIGQVYTMRALLGV